MSAQPVPQTNAQLARLDRKLTHLLAEEEKIREKLHKNLERQTALEKRRDELHRHATSLSPILILPTELLMQIFELSVFPEEYTAEEVECAAVCALALSHVCSRWRHISISMACLWSYVALNSSSMAMLDLFLLRSRKHPLVYCPSSAFDELMIAKQVNVLRDGALPRLKALICSGTTPTVTFMLRMLQWQMFPNLRVLELQGGGDQCTILSFGARRRMHTLSMLTHIRLAHIVLDVMPICQLPSLRSLHVSDSPLLCSSLAHAPRLSMLCAHLSRAPNLETLTMDNYDLVVDVNLGSPHEGALEAVNLPLFPSEPPIISQTEVAHLRNFHWYHCPPKDLWRLFHYISMPVLTHLELSLQVVTSRIRLRWGDRSVPMRPGTPHALHGISAVICFDQLQHLSLECRDLPGLNLATRKFLFPNLRSLDLAFIPREEDAFNLRSFPALGEPGSVFREPRMPNLTSLGLSRFTLSLNTMIMYLGYMPNLKTLTLDTCPGAAHIVQSMAYQVPNSSRRWSCPRLERMVLIGCDDVTSANLTDVLFARKKQAEAGPATQASVSGRVIKPLRRKVKAPTAGCESPHPPDYGTNNQSGISAIKSIRIQECVLISHDDCAALSKLFDIEYTYEP
ncbi:hypothetical protein K474DRAFT_1694869 [Panus rudis PR-1116 ss-1]|nr:hypothetical protein K474DRAFT_1694869 [Panus rudis PR-1116 ss-1]